MTRSLKTATTSRAPVRKHGMAFTKQTLKGMVKSGDRFFHSLLHSLQARSKKAPIVLFGAGEGGRKTKALLEKAGVTPAFFSDSDARKWGRLVAGLPVIPPVCIAELPHPHVVISASDTSAIARSLRAIGVEGIEARLYLMLQTIPYRDAFLRNQDELERVRALLADARSLHTFDALCAHAFSLNAALLSSVCEPRQYFFGEPFAVHQGDVFVDVGAWQGDTLRAVLRRFGARFHSVHCFEPNAESCAALRAFIRARHLCGKVFAHPVAVGDAPGRAYFSGTGTGYHRSGEGEQGASVAMTTLDAVFARSRVDFIKFDIEGAEPEALRGAQKIITRGLPRLAVCIYHAPEHFWEIPLMLAKMVPEYTFYLRHHSRGLYETVWYAARR